MQIHDLAWQVNEPHYINSFGTDAQQTSVRYKLLISYHMKLTCIRPKVNDVGVPFLKAFFHAGCNGP